MLSRAVDSSALIVHDEWQARGKGRCVIATAFVFLNKAIFQPSPQARLEQPLKVKRGDHQGLLVTFQDARPLRGCLLAYPCAHGKAICIFSGRRLIIKHPLRLFIFQVQGYDELLEYSAVHTEADQETQDDTVAGGFERWEVEKVVVKAQQALMFFLPLQEVLRQTTENGGVVRGCAKILEHGYLMIA